MNTQEAAALLAIAAAFDNRKPDPDAATAWAAALDGLRFTDCREAIVAHYRTSSDWLMPAMVVAGVKQLRTERIRNFGPLPEPPPEVGDHEWAAWKRDLLRRIGDGEQVERPPELAPSAEHEQRLRRLIRGGAA